MNADKDSNIKKFIRLFVFYISYPENLRLSASKKIKIHHYPLIYVLIYFT